MSKRCMPGVICIENVTVVIFLLIIAAIVLFFNFYNKPSTMTPSTMRPSSTMHPSSTMQAPMRFLPNLFNPPQDILLNPYAPPMRDDRYFPDRTFGDPRGVPINIQTQTADSPYRQMGILTRLDGTEMILPLMGRPLFTNRDKWNFYTMNDKTNMIKLPIIYNGKNCTSEYGCDNLYDGNIVRVEGYNTDFKVTMYDNQVMRYIPFL
jgi:hypothetical protein